jgi:hypothetical protein
VEITACAWLPDNYTATSVQAAWDNHFAAFGGQDVDQIMLDYTEASVLWAWDHADLDSNVTVATGLDEIRDFFGGLFAQLDDLELLAAPVVDVTEEPAQVYLIWSCPSSDIESATDTFIFDEANKILRQNIAFTTGSTPNAYDSITTTSADAADSPVAVDSNYSAATIAEAWDNHFGGFGGQDVEMIMQVHRTSTHSMFYIYARWRCRVDHEVF